LQPTISVFVAVSMIALQPFRESYSILPERTVIEVSPEQPEKAEEPMLVTLLGISTEVILVQPEKAEEPMEITVYTCPE